jgi:integrase/recombinase XerD
VAAVFAATCDLKHRAILMTIYFAGLRVSELTNLQVMDIDSPPQVICVRQGKGHKDLVMSRQVPLDYVMYAAMKPKVLPQNLITSTVQTPVQFGRRHTRLQAQSPA